MKHTSCSAHRRPGSCDSSQVTWSLNRQDAKAAKKTGVLLSANRPWRTWRLGGQFSEVSCLSTPAPGSGARNWSRQSRRPPPRSCRKPSWIVDCLCIWAWILRAMEYPRLPLDIESSISWQTAWLQGWCEFDGSIALGRRASNPGPPCARRRPAPHTKGDPNHHRR